uniref:Uncharacterized protein n=1 Tax=Romanomermis culicivorax TaxID=13658 RepID=A0A915JHD7_ROMCU
MLLEQLIQCWDRDCKEGQTGQGNNDYQLNECQPTANHESQPRDKYNNRFDHSRSRNRWPPMQYQSTGLWCNAHKSHTHNTEDCVWLQTQNAQPNNYQDPG